MVHMCAGLVLLLASGRAAANQQLAGRDEAKYPDHGKLEACQGYRVTEAENTSQEAHLKLQLIGDKSCSVYGTDLPEIRVDLQYETEDRIHLVIQDPHNFAYQIPKSVLPRPKAEERVLAEASPIRFSYTNNPFTFTIARRETNEVLFNSSAASFVFQDQYIRLRTHLPPDPYLYGLGEHSDPYRLNTTNYIRTMWNRDAGAVPPGTNLYGSHPFYLEHRETGSHGVFLANSNGMDVLIDKDEKGDQFLEYNTLGGVVDLYFMAGPSPVEVVQQYGEVVGKPAMQPYWGLGFHQCRYGYQDAYELAEVVYNYSLAHIPLETMWTDIDYMDRRRVFTLDPQRFPRQMMRELVQTLHERDQHFVLMVDPAVAYVERHWKDYRVLTRGHQHHAFLRHANHSDWLGAVWPGVVVYPDWFARGATPYWIGEFDIFFDKDKGVDIDGLWIDMNEPANFCPFPCDDPYAAAKGNPPEPPPLRAWPRPLPGWPCSFQPEWSAPTDCQGQYNHKRDLTIGDDKDDEEYRLDEAFDDDRDDYDYDEEFQDLVEASDTNHDGNVDSDELATAVDQDMPLNYPPSIPSQLLVHDDDEAITNTSSLSRRTTSTYRGTRRGLGTRDLLYPKYAIHNAAAHQPSWNADRGGLSNHTVSTDVVHRNNLTMYDTHNLYGMMMGMASRKAMLHRRPYRRPFIISRSSFAGAGAHYGHWLGDNLSSWPKYREAVRHMLGFASLFQFNMVGADVCGFIGDTNEELCARWAVLGAFSPFYRNHNDQGARPQEFYRWESVAAAARRAIDLRYRLLDYMYTTMWLASATGSPTLYPTFFLYPEDRQAWALDLQYFFGKSLLVAPVTEEGATSVDVYLPRGSAFYAWDTHELLRGGSDRGRAHTFANQSLSDIPLLVRAGTIMPLRVASANTTAQLREHGFELRIFVDGQHRAKGELYLDDGDLLYGAHSYVAFSYEGGVLTIDGRFDYLPAVGIKRVTLVGAGVYSTPMEQREVAGDGEGAAEIAKRNAEERLRSRNTITFEMDIPLDKASNITMALNRIQGQNVMGQQP